MVTSQLKHNLADIRAHVVNINVDGISRTKDDFIANMVNDRFKNVGNFLEMLVRSIKLQQQLKGLGIFKQVFLSIDTNKGHIEDGYDLTYTVKEYNSHAASANMSVSNHGPFIAVKTQLINPGGRAERFAAEYSFDNKKTNKFVLNLTKPLSPWDWPYPVGRATLFQSGINQYWSGFREIDRGLLINLSTQLRQDTDHNLSWEALWREVGPMSFEKNEIPLTGFQIREQFGHTIKSSIKHILKFDNRDSRFLPSEGTLLKLEQELAFGGSTFFHKHQFEIQQSLPLLSDISLQGTFKAGFMRHKHSLPNYIMDRFFIGGPLNVRGFQTFQIGPQSDGNFLGATAFWTCGLHLYTPLPFLPKHNFFYNFLRIHGFFNGGNIGDFTLSGNHYKDLENLGRFCRMSAGLGLALSLREIARLELHYCIPFSFQPADKIQKGFAVDSKCNPRNTTNSRGKKRKPGSKTLNMVINCDDEVFTHFLKRCLEWNPLNRITPEKAIKHPLFHSIIKPSKGESKTCDLVTEREATSKTFQFLTCKQTETESMPSANIYNYVKTNRSHLAKERKESACKVNILTKSSSDDSINLKCMDLKKEKNGCIMRLGNESDSGTFLPPIL